MKIYCDSSTKGACIVVDLQTPSFYRYDAPVTNNVGEYMAVIIALMEINKQRMGGGVEILTDSQLVVSQINLTWKCRMPHLLPLRDEARRLIQKLSATVRWIPREENLAGKHLG